MLVIAVQSRKERTKSWNEGKAKGDDREARIPLINEVENLVAVDGHLFGSGSVRTSSERVRKILGHPEPRTGPSVRFTPSPEP